MKKSTVELINVRSNLEITTRERGKIKQRVKGHNIWLNLGREYLVQLIGYSSFSPDLTFRDDRIKYMGVGIGGTKQIAPGVANIDPLLTAYPGTNLYVDTDPTLTVLERPVRVSGGSSAPPYLVVSDEWLGRVQAPATFPAVTQINFRRVFSQAEISYNPFLTVPLSEVMLYTSAANVNSASNTGVAYDTFPTISKTAAFDLEVSWTIRF